MSAESAPEEAELRDRISLFVQRNFPQIGMHGGHHAISHLDVEAGEVTLELGGACSGCGISPMTIQALKARLVREIPEIRVVHASTAESDVGTPRGFDPDEVPF